MTRMGISRMSRSTKHWGKGRSWYITEQNLLVGKFWNKPVAETVRKGRPVLESGDGSGPRPDWERRRVPEGLVEKPAEGGNTVIGTWIEIAESLRQKCERNIQQPILDKAGRQILDEHALDILAMRLSAGWEQADISGIDASFPLRIIHIAVHDETGKHAYIHRTERELKSGAGPGMKLLSID